MKLRGEFAVREVADRVIAVPVGKWAVEFQSMILLNRVSRVIWDCLAEDTAISAIVHALTERFEVSEAQALADTEEFLENLRKAGLLEESDQ